MKPSHKIALAGAVWFFVVSVLGLPITIYILSVFLSFRPDVFFSMKFAFLHFGLPAALVGLIFANRIVHADSLMSFVRLGIFIVVSTSLLAALFLSISDSRAVGFTEFIIDFAIVAASFLMFDVVFFWCIPFIISGIASVVFYRAIQCTTWVDGSN